MTTAAAAPPVEKPEMKFRRVGGSWQLSLQDFTDLARVLELDEAHWALTSVRLDAMRTDLQFLKFLDADQNGVIRADEVKAAVRWFTTMIRAEKIVNLGGEELPVAAINTKAPGGPLLKSAAGIILRNLGSPHAEKITLSQIRNDKEIVNPTSCNGDGVITVPGLTEAGASPELLKFLGDVMAQGGTVIDVSGAPGIDGALLEKFAADAALYLGWLNAPKNSPETLVPFGEETAGFSARLAKTRSQIDQFFLSAAALDFLADAPDRLKKVDAAADILTPAGVAGFLAGIAIAQPTPEGMLDFDGALNPLYAAELSALAATTPMQAFLKEGKLSYADWQALKAKLAPYEAWSASKPATVFEKFDPAELAAKLADGSIDRLRKFIAADLAVSAELNETDTLLKLILYHRYLPELLNNYVSLSGLFNPRTFSMIQAGSLVIDSRHFTLVTPVFDIAEHKRIATLSDICVMYLEVVTGPPAAQKKMNLAVAVTSGSMRNLFVGKRGIFLAPDGASWDARVIDFIQQPVSISEALKMPFFRFGEFIGKQADKFFSSKSSDAQKMLEADFGKAATNMTAPAPVKAQTPAVSGSMMLMGGGIGIAAIGSSVAFIAKSLQNISILNVLAVLFGIILIFGGPMVVISLVKLFRRNMSRFLEANGCAVNRHMRLSRRMGDIFSHAPPLPQSALIKGDLVNLFRPEKKRKVHWGYYLALAVVLLIAAAVYWYAYLRPAPTPPPAVVEASAAQH